MSYKQLCGTILLLVTISLRILTIFLFGISSVVYASGSLAYHIRKDISLPKDCFTQGFLIYQQHFYISCGHYGKSRLIKTDMTGKLVTEKTLPKHIFAEGITIFDKQLYLLTWKEQTAYVFNPEDLTQVKTINYQGEGWGLSTIGKSLIMSNGSHQLQIKNPDNFITLQTLSTTSNQQILIQHINELEHIGSITFANILQSNEVILLSDKGYSYIKEIAHIDLSAITKKHNSLMGDRVLNGIAYDKDADCLWVTGKEWGVAYALSITSKEKPTTIPAALFKCNIADIAIETNNISGQHIGATQELTDE